VYNIRAGSAAVEEEASMGKTRVLVVEDDKNIAKLIKYNVEKEGFTCLNAYTGEDAMETLSKGRADIVVLDIMLPGMDGLEVCRKIRQEKALSGLPIIMLTAKGEEVDRIVGFELGADDYMVKPFSPRELILRIKAILKRDSKEDAREEETLEARKLVVDITRHRVTVSGKEVDLTNMEFNLLRTLMSRKGRVQSRDKLLDEVWDIAADVTTRTVDTHIKRLRTKLGKEGNLIETVRGVGYRFSEEY
jgi:two-component system, OmpR family, phosphate regulon response regulator PhoB